MKVIKVDDFKKAFCDTNCFENFHVDFDGKVYVDITSFLNFLDTMPTIEAEPIKPMIEKFRDYQIEWLTDHCDIELCEELESLIIRFLNDTAECFIRETDKV